MYKIILKTWYQETPDKSYNEIYHSLEFENIEKAVKYVNDNIEKILDEFPVEGLTINNKLPVNDRYKEGWADCLKINGLDEKGNKQ